MCLHFRSSRLKFIHNSEYLGDFFWVTLFPKLRVSHRDDYFLGYIVYTTLLTLKIELQCNRLNIVRDISKFIPGFNRLE